MSSLPSRIVGRVWKFGDSIDTNQLAGGGVTVSNDPAENLRANCLLGMRPDFTAGVQQGDIIVAGKNFGCGSHRQTAVEAIQLCGVAAVVAESVARIHMRNSIACALPTFTVPSVGELVEDGDQIEIDYENGVVRNLRTGGGLPFQKFPPAVEQIYADGGLFQVIARRLALEGIVPPPSKE